MDFDAECSAVHDLSCPVSGSVRGSIDLLKKLSLVVAKIFGLGRGGVLNQ